MPRLLLKEPIEARTATAQVALVEFWADKEPSLHEATVYWWRLRLDGSRDFDRVRQLRINLAFSPEFNLSIREIVPRKTEKGD